MKDLQQIIDIYPLSGDDIGTPLYTLKIPCGFYARSWKPVLAYTPDSPKDSKPIWITSLGLAPHGEQPWHSAFADEDVLQQDFEPADTLQLCIMPHQDAGKIFHNLQAFDEAVRKEADFITDAGALYTNKDPSLTDFKDQSPLKPGMATPVRVVVRYVVPEPA